MTKSKTNNKSIVAQRLGWLEGKRVRARVRSEPGKPEVIYGKYLDLMPLGRTYLLVFEVEGKSHLVPSEQIHDLVEI